MLQMPPIENGEISTLEAQPVLIKGRGPLSKGEFYEKENNA